MMPKHRNMVRSQARVLESAGTLLGGFLATLRLSPQPGRAEALRASLRETLARLAMEPGIAGAHLLLTDTPVAAETTEQRLRGGRDAAADWVVLMAGSTRPLCEIASQQASTPSDWKRRAPRRRLIAGTSASLTP